MIPDDELHRKLVSLSLLRILFALLLLLSTVFLRNARLAPGDEASAAILAGMAAFMAAALLLLGLTLAAFIGKRLLAKIHIGFDTLAVTAMLIATGGYASLFSFLYLVVIVYSSLLMSRRSTLTMAALCGIQYGLIVTIEYYGWMNPFAPSALPLAEAAAWGEILFKVVILLGACIGVAFLSSLLAEQTRRTRQELQIMAAHVRRVEKMAAIGEVAAGLAHEVKNPLASLSGAIQLLRDDLPCDPDHDRLMKIILREADRLSTLVSNFLLYARPPAGRPAPVDLEKALRETVELFSKRPPAGKTIQTELRAERGIWVHLDPAHLKQVLWNLLVNAAEAIAESGRIRVSLAAGRDRTARLEIADTGSGMSAETLKAIFDPFFTTKPSGTGLGLPIALRIIESYNGRLDVESHEGRGTCFRLFLPRIESPSASWVELHSSDLFAERRGPEPGAAGAGGRS
jgi:two-component system sensor histidine kinase PilS (NtrC family)